MLGVTSVTAHQVGKARLPANAKTQADERGGEENGAEALQVSPRGWLYCW